MKCIESGLKPSSTWPLTVVIFAIVVDEAEGLTTSIARRANVMPKAQMEVVRAGDDGRRGKKALKCAENAHRKY